jgi:uncharacterized protein (TIGR02271 family)
MFDRSQIQEGMTVRSSDGDKLGRVYAIGDTEFFIEKGLFFPKDYACRYADIADIRNGEVHLLHGRESLRKASEAEPVRTYETGAGTTEAGLGSTPVTGVGTGVIPPAYGTSVQEPGLGERTVSARSEEVAIPVQHEELDVLKREVQAGEVRVEKTVVEEEETLEVPVRRERAVVERRQVAERPAVSASFQEETVSVPLRAEEVETRKRAVVDEEVVIRKEELEEEQVISEPLRREEVEIRGAKASEESRKLDLSSDKEPPKRK